MKKAQNLIEVSLVLVLVVVVSLSLWPLFNNQKTKLAELSESNINTQSISGRKIQLKNNVLGLAGEMGLVINNNKTPSDILNDVGDKIGKMAASGADASKIKEYEERYNALVNEQAAINALNLTVNDNKMIAGATGGKVSGSTTVSLSNTSQGLGSTTGNLPTSGSTNGSTTNPPIVSVTGMNAGGNKIVGAINGDNKINNDKYAPPPTPGTINNENRPTIQTQLKIEGAGSLATDTLEEKRQAETTTKP